MLQKAKSIKKTIKTEVKAIAYGTERVDKRGKAVTSIADRTNVSAFFFRFTRCLILFKRKIVYT
jgi:cytochrome oxidase Cu insertion factor (SCO1/SenC/PrrC family)